MVSRLIYNISSVNSIDPVVRGMSSYRWCKNCKVGDLANFSLDYVEDINDTNFYYDFMLSLYTAGQLHSVVLFLLYAPVFIIGLLGNACVIAVVLFSSRFRNMTNLYLCNMAVSDFAGRNRFFIKYNTGKYKCNVLALAYNCPSHPTDPQLHLRQII